MFTTNGQLETPYKPVPGRVHPRESSFLHRQGKAIKDEYGRIIGRKGENVRKQRHTVCGLRDKMAGASSSAKVTRFVNVNGRLDGHIDAASQPGPCLTPPAPRRAVRRPRSSHRSLASSI